MDATEALDELFRVSDDVRAAVVFARGGDLIASNLPDDEASDLAATADAMLTSAETLRKTVPVSQLRAASPRGDVYLVRDGDRAVVAVTAPGALPGLVRHDLRTLLTRVPKRRKTPAHA
jgi:predicted regulator of Ras-like GTPase activity (Roadblock/LC7/MglB family)